MSYRKYYNLEEYLFNEVGSKYRKNGFLSIEDFFCIVIWKANRSKTKIKKKLSKNKPLRESIKNIAINIFQAENPEKKLDVLIKKWGFGLPMATAILTVLYPEQFTVYDYRIRQQLGLKNIYSTKKYFEYFLPKVMAYAKDEDITLREADKELWGKSFHDDLLSLIE